jgi:steroid 5-alpha reductase family enzyme
MAAYVVAMLMAFAEVALLGAAHPIRVAAAADLTAVVVVFLFSIILDNSSVYAPYWSVAPPIIVGYWAAQGNFGLRQVVILVLVLSWAIRLTGNWACRWAGPADEDFRYREIRDGTGNGYWPASFVLIHLMPTVWGFLGLLPLYPALAQSGKFGTLDGVAALVVISAIAFETIADEQLRRFRRSPHAPSAVLTAGLWARCRHPNYLGELAFWWGMFLFGVAAQPDWAWTAVGAISITLLFVLTSVPWMDRHMLVGHRDWALYARNLPALVPWVPRRIWPLNRPRRFPSPGTELLTARWRIVIAVGLMAANLLAGGMLALRYKHSCVVNGKRYYSGQAVPIWNGHNHFWCNNGEVEAASLFCSRLPP